MACFNIAATKILDFNEHVVMLALKMGLKPSKLTFSIDKSSPKDYATLLGKAYKYALAEEQAASHRQDKGKSTKKGNKELYTYNSEFRSLMVYTVKNGKGLRCWPSRWG